MSLIGISAKMQIQSEQTVKRQKNTRNTLSEKKYCYSELILRDCCVRHVFNKLQTYKNGTSDCLIAVFGDFKLFSTVKLLLLIKCIIFSFSLMIHQFLWSDYHTMFTPPTKTSPLLQILKLCLCLGYLHGNYIPVWALVLYSGLLLYLMIVPLEYKARYKLHL